MLIVMDKQLKVVMLQKSIVFIFVGMILLLSCDNESIKEETREVTSSIPKIEIVFPQMTGEFEKIRTKLPNPEFSGDSIINIILQGKDVNGPYMFYFTRYLLSPQQTRVFSKNDKLREDYIRQNIYVAGEKMGGDNFSFAPIDHNELSGTEGACSVFAGDGILKYRMFIVDSHVFVICAGGQRISEAVVNNFLNSFKIGND